jgi:hypothetical protein
MILDVGFSLLQIFVAAAALLFFVLAMVRAPGASGAAKRSPSHLWVAGQALLAVCFVAQLTKSRFRQPMERFDVFVTVTLFVAVVVTLAALALSYWRLYRQSQP